ncbi:phosphotransferase enzyme family protein [Metarhizium rileyi]|uniref:Phosphotransferase enzyme family protein n=1 Tax=Metarhizium rileyi (strain RCEF 4871) TaxID=1649241 RepID=A0A166ZNW9_METRR|nr:phosphotransferase enzyme family protein [Metarhizium rileyi RCEF 4871]
MSIFGSATSRIHQERRDFVDAILNRQDDLLQLASSIHTEALQCQFFRPRGHENHFTQGTFNICFFIQFCTGARCVVRIPLRPCLAISSRSKIESEIATMSLLHEQTKIPIPKIYAYSINETADPLSTFIIMEYIGGEKLSADRLDNATDQEKNSLYKSLAAIYIQLRRLEFPAIGRLVGHAGGYEVKQQVLTVDTNGLELEGLNPFTTQLSYHNNKDTLTSAKDYIAMRLQISWTAFLKSRSNVEREMGANALYHLHLFHQHVDEWMDPSLDQGPFTLVHGDMGPHNILVDDDMNIMAVIDWEWSRVVPVQFFTPPLWLTCRSTVSLSAPSSYRLYLMTALSDFLGVVKAQELAACGNDLLSGEWAARKEDGGPLVANALENWTDIDWFAYRYLSRGKDDEVDEHVEAFLRADPIRASIARMKEDDALVTEAMSRLEDDESRHDSKSRNTGVADESSRRWTTVLGTDAFPSFQYTKPWTVQSTSVVIVIGVFGLGLYAIGKRIEIIPNLLNRQ